ncbi:unnamed protein product, partial [Symbiodinium pilosum]
ATGWQMPGKAPVIFQHEGLFGVPEDGEVYDIFFDARVDDMQVVLKDICTGKQIAAKDIVQEEGQYATRLVRFFRYYEEKSSQIRPLLQSEKTGACCAAVAQDVELMMHELLAL